MRTAVTMERESLNLRLRVAQSEERMFYHMRQYILQLTDHSSSWIVPVHTRDPEKLSLATQSPCVLPLNAAVFVPS